MNKKLLIAGAAIAIFGTGLVTTSTYAATSSNNGSFMSGLVQKIADTFHLNKNDVQNVFNQYKQDQIAKHEQQFEERLAQAVKDGKITEAQKAAILAKFKDFMSNKQQLRQDFKNMTPDQRKAARDRAKADLEAWAQQNGLSLATLRNLVGGFEMKGHFLRRGM